MSMKSTLYSILSTVFEGEFYPVQHPDPDGTETEVASLYAIYNVIGGKSFQTLKGDKNLSRPRIQISICGLNYDDVDAKRIAVNTAMKAANDLYNQAASSGVDFTTVAGALPNISTAVPIDGYEHDTKRFSLIMEFYIWDVGN